MKSWHSPDGILWGVDVDLAGSSNAMVIFRHPSGASSRLDRYNWFISTGPEARSVTSHLSKAKVLEALSQDDILRLYRRSMKVSRPDPLLPAAASNG
ncbi:MAG TPA: hypothetical protein VGM67_20680 [Gemmatimonadaceae bacterium]|jgi:hypothetical protein